MTPEYNQNLFYLIHHQIFKGFQFDCYSGIPSEVSLGHIPLHELRVVLFEPSEGSCFQVSATPNSTLFMPDVLTKEGQKMIAHTPNSGRSIEVLPVNPMKREQVDLHFKVTQGETGFKSIWYWGPNQKKFVSVQQKQVGEMHYEQGVSFIPVPGGELFILPTSFIFDRESLAHRELTRKFSH